MRGRIHQINVKPATPGEHGLPKWPVESAQITRAGLLGDFNIYRHESRHDDPDSAVLLMSLETLEQLNAEGWPLRPGDIGENFTTAGIPYARFSPGKTFRLGTAEVQISRACKPCTNLYLLPYVGVEKGPGFLKVMLDRRGWYARVLKEGRAKKGDSIEELSPT
ncbi:MAG: MOSC domain-containing protein [Nitrososphaerales archaeon]|nr:MOSC domain-containing protein [Nitrososphaerales archaeon]